MRWRVYLGWVLISWTAVRNSFLALACLSLFTPSNILHLHVMTRPLLNVDVLPPAKGHNLVAVHLLVLLLANPAIFTACWDNLWQPLVFLCILERTMFFLGLFCLAWTMMVTKVVALAVHCGVGLWSFQIRRLLYGPQALVAELRKERRDPVLFVFVFDFLLTLSVKYFYGRTRRTK